MTIFTSKSRDEVGETLLDTKVWKGREKCDKTDDTIEYTNFWNTEILRDKYLDNIPSWCDDKAEKIEPKSFFEKCFRKWCRRLNHKLDISIYMFDYINLHCFSKIFPILLTSLLKKYFSMSDMLLSLQDLFQNNPLGQTLGLIAFWISVYNFLYCRDKRFIFFTLIASCVWGVHFFILWLLSAAYINFVDVLKNALALRYEKNTYITLGFIGVYIVISYFTYTGIISLIPLFTAILSTILVFYVRWVYLNAWFLVVIALWLVYNIVWWSIGGVMTDLTLMVSWIIWIYKIILSEKQK